MIEERVTRGKFDDSPRCSRCNTLLDRNPYDYAQKYCPAGCGYAVRREEMMPGAAREPKHHHFCTAVILGLGYTDIGLCNICGHYLFIKTSVDGTTYRVANQREDELITNLVHTKAQIARATNDR